MFEIWITDGTYIQGKKIGTVGDLRDAVKKGKARLEKEGHETPIRSSRDKKDTWLDDANGMPVGVIIETTPPKKG